ncbi:hypothetical protein D3C87_1876170 [compost metagenome]
MQLDPAELFGGPDADFFRQTRQADADQRADEQEFCNMVTRCDGVDRVFAGSGITELDGSQIRPVDDA